MYQCIAYDGVQLFDRVFLNNFNTYLPKFIPYSITVRDDIFKLYGTGWYKCRTCF